MSIPGFRFAIFVLLAAASCGGGGELGDGDGDAGVDATVDRACARTPRPADGPRFGVVSHPFADGGGQANVYEVFEVDAAGAITPTGTTFSMGRSNSDTIAFTIDGAIGVVAQDDGSLGVFALDSAGAPTVLAAAYSGAFYASEVRMDRGGSRIHVLDGEFRDIGGGLYSLAIDCDGNLIDEGLIAGAQLPMDLVDVGDTGRRLVPADNILDSSGALDVHLIDLTAPGAPTWISGASLFGGSDAIVSDAAVTSSGSFALIGDNCGFCGANRIAVAAIDGDSIEFVQTLTPFEDPYDLVASPFDDRVLAVSGFGNAVFELVPSGNPGIPYMDPLEMVYIGSPPQLPANPVMIKRGALEGLVLLPENLGVRRIQFEAGISPTDLGLTTFGAGSTAIVGSVGIQP